jgi:hypothetical protein
MSDEENLIPLSNLNRGGRPRGALNRATKYHQEFCRAIVESPEYRTWLVTRIMDGTLPAAIEMLLHYYAYGKPRERLEISSGSGLDGLSTEDLLARAQEMGRLAMELKEAEERRRVARALPVGARVEPEGTNPPED